MSAVFKREFKSFFTGPIAYFVWAMLFAFSGWYFYVYNLSYGYVNLKGCYGGLYTITILIIVPILTMRLFSEERRQRTDQALLTAPVSLTGIVVGKFLAAWLVFAIGLAITFVYAIVIACVATPAWLTIFGNYIGLLLLAGNLIAAGLFFSCLTESQFIAALCTFAFSFALLLLDSVTSMFSNIAWLTSAVNFLSVGNRYDEFAAGTISYGNIIYFLSMQVLFLFLSVRVLDSRKWN